MPKKQPFFTHFTTAQKLIKAILIEVLTTKELFERTKLTLLDSGQISIEVDIDFVSSLQMKKLNFKYRKKNKPTDVLSFESPLIFKKQGNLGQLIICAPVMKQQAKEYKHSEKHELAVLLVHGVLHLLGFDHERSTRHAKEMAKWENRLINQILTSPTQTLLQRSL